MTNSNSCTATFTQMAGVAALTESQKPSEDMVAEFRKRRDVIVAGLNDIPGVTCATPGGAFYAFPNITGLAIPSADLARRLLHEAGVACLSGTDFGEHGEGYLRFSYAASNDAITRAIARMREFIATIR
jgi:aspartate/methionine/tyrosine aminotransferase